ncbi:MAG: restriction endonuclease subunit S [Acidimicrobiales bacterium]
MKTKEIELSRLEPYDLLFARQSLVLEGTGKCAVFLGHPEVTTFESHLIRVRLDQALTNPLFYYYFFKSVQGRGLVQSITMQVAASGIRASELQDLRVPFPSLEGQNKIVAVLSAYDDLIENNNRRIKLLEEMAQRIYREWFIDFRYPGHEAVPLADSELGPIPRGWDWKQLRDIATEIRVSVDPGAIDPDTPYVGLEHMPERSIALCKWGTAKSAGSRKFKFVAGDVLFGKIRPYFHKVSVAPVDGICSTDAVVVRSRTPDAYGVVVSVVSSDAFVAEAVQSSQGTKMPRANWSVLENYPIAMPAQPILEKFNMIVNDAVSLIHRMVRTNRNLRVTRDVLLPRLISGELDVSDFDIALPEAAS